MKSNKMSIPQETMVRNHKKGTDMSEKCVTVVFGRDKSPIRTSRSPQRFNWG